ncbi:hypothetical protein BX070DRAFT_252939 [Coemansia spiralis]|nr:hypothetical protein BX070DRAFT_252939 [Coemansia spiralis]
MSDGGDTSDLVMISTALGAEIQKSATPDQAPGAAAESVKKGKGAGGSSGNKNKRARKSSKANKVANAEQETEDINLHVEAGWSEDEKYDKEHSAKRIATEGESGSPVAVKKNSEHLDNFTIRTVVTRKDVDVIFESEPGKKQEIEAQTGASISIIAGKDDPDIVVDRVLSIKGQIDGVAATYKIITEGMLKIKESSAAAAATASKSSSVSDAVADADNEATTEEKDAEDTGDQQKEKASPEDKAVADTGESTAAIIDRSVGDLADENADSTNSGEGGAKPASEDSKPKDGSANDTTGKRITLRMLVPHKCVGSIMGHGGKTINNIRDVTSVTIHTSESTLPRSSERIVQLVGAPECIEKAIRLIAEALTKDIAAYTSADYYVPAANLPSAMTVETNSRKRKDQKKHGHSDHHGGNRGHSAGNKGGGFRGGNHGGYGQNRNHSNSANSHRSNNGGGGAGAHGGNRNDRYGRQNDRQGGRGRGSSSMSHPNRVPVGSGGGLQGQQGQYNSGGGYRMGGNQSGGARQSAGHGHGGAMGYGGGYAMPTAGAYSGYGGQSAAAGGGAGSHGTRYGSNTAPAGPTHAVPAYGGGYGASSAAYQFPAPVSYGYAPAPAQNMYNNRPPQQTGTYSSRPYAAARGGRPPQMSQPAMATGPVGGAGPAIGGTGSEAAGQAIQQMYVPGDKIGAIIGRRGETINEIRRFTNAHVDIQDSAPGAKKRLILITGAYEQVRSAYHMINEKLESARPSMRP